MGVFGMGRQASGIGMVPRHSHILEIGYTSGQAKCLGVDPGAS